jgi:hypothetical protein
MKTKIQIKSISGTVLFEHEAENNTIAKTISEADLGGADLSWANLSGADLGGADLSWANLSGAKNIDKLSGLDSFRNDIWAILLFAQPEVAGLKQALIDGRINGSAYEGTCACLCGTIANIRQCSYQQLDHITPDVHRPAEQWFMSIHTGDTPKDNGFAKLALAWIEEFESAFPAPKVQKAAA